MGKHDAREKIERAMLTLVDARRFSDITVGEIIRCAGVNRSTFYYHYCDKFALRDAIVDDLLCQLRSSVPLRPGSSSAPAVPDIAATVGLLHARRELFLRLTNPNWEIDTLSLANSYFAGLAADWAKAQPRQGYDPELFAGLYAASALTTALWSFRCGVDENAVAEIISDHLQRGFFRSFVEPKPDE